MTNYTRQYALPKIFNDPVTISLLMTVLGRAITDFSKLDGGPTSGAFLAMLGESAHTVLHEDFDDEPLVSQSHEEAVDMLIKMVSRAVDLYRDPNASVREILH